MRQEIGGSPRVAAGRMETSRTIAPMVADNHVPETPRRELARCLRQAPLLADIFTNDSGTNEELAHRRKKGEVLRSGKVRTADSTVIYLANKV